MKKLLSILLIAFVLTSIFINPAFAEPIKYNSSKGTYTIDFAAGTYHACLNEGGCISLGPKKFGGCSTDPDSGECEAATWTNGPYDYEVAEGTLIVTKNGKIIFTDQLKELS